jgi:hypothetical protein
MKWHHDLFYWESRSQLDDGGGNRTDKFYNTGFIQQTLTHTGFQFPIHNLCGDIDTICSWPQHLALKHTSKMANSTYHTF